MQGSQQGIGRICYMDALTDHFWNLGIVLPIASRQQDALAGESRGPLLGNASQEPWEQCRMAVVFPVFTTRGSAQWTRDWQE
jgi:hypothetical protein